MQKDVAGARLRRLREERRMTQAAFARMLGISPSYLNQIEHGSRPLTVPVLLSISESLGVDAGFFATHDTARLTAEIREVSSDDTLRIDIPVQEATELAQRLPHTAHALVTMHRRYRQLAERLAALTGDREHESGELGSGPHEEIRDYFYQRHNYIAELDEAAERLAGGSASVPATCVRCWRSGWGCTASGSGSVIRAPGTTATNCTGTTREVSYCTSPVTFAPVSWRSGWRPSSPSPRWARASTTWSTRRP